MGRRYANCRTKRRGCGASRRSSENEAMCALLCDATWRQEKFARVFERPRGGESRLLGLIIYSLSALARQIGQSSVRTKAFGAGIGAIYCFVTV